MILDDHLIEYKGFDIVFEQPFLDKYPIINKTNGIKNLRCFPCCTAPFHSKQGFCGQSVNIRLFFYRYVTFIHKHIYSFKHTLIYTYIHTYTQKFIHSDSYRSLFILHIQYIMLPWFHSVIYIHKVTSSIHILPHP